jgi:hypothetical protein
MKTGAYAVSDYVRSGSRTLFRLILSQAAGALTNKGDCGSCWRPPSSSGPISRLRRNQNRRGIRQLPMRVNLRGSICTERSRPGGTNESSPVRSAGVAFEKNDPSRTGRSTVAYASEAAYERARSQNTSVVPAASGTGCLLKPLTQHFVLGYFHRVPPGRVFGACF